MADTLRDFLIRIGYDFDEEKGRRFVESMRTAQLQAILLADALENMARKAWDATSGAAESFDKLYYASQRNNITVENIKAIGFAAAQTGASAQEAAAAIEGMGRKLRENSAEIAGIRHLGFDKNAITGQLEYSQRLGEQFAKLSKSQQEWWGQYYGISENLIESLRHPAQFEAAIDASKKLTAGFSDQAAKDAQEFMFSFRNMWNDIDTKTDKGLTRLLKGLTPVLNDFGAFLKAHDQDIDRWIRQFTEGIVNQISAWQQWLATVDWKQVNKTLTDLNVNISNAATVFELFFGVWVTAKAAAAIQAMKTVAGLLGLFKGIPLALALPLALGGDTDTGGTRHTAAERAARAKELDEYDRTHSPWQQFKGWVGGLFGGGGAGGSSSNPDGSQGKPIYVKPADTGGNSMWDWLFGRAGAAELPGGGRSPSGGGGGATIPAAETEGGSVGGRHGLMNRLIGGMGARTGRSGLSDRVSGASGELNTTQQQRAVDLMNRLVNDHGWTPTAAAIAAGNAVAESNVRTDLVGDNGTAHGLFQWRGNRLANLQAFAAKSGGDWRDPAIQTTFFDQETQQRSGFERGWKNATDFSQSGEYGKAFEQYAGGIQASRTRWAKEALAAYNASKTKSATTSLTESDGGAYQNFGQLYKGGQTFGHAITGATDKGAYVDGQWIPWWAHLPGSPANTEPRTATGNTTAADVDRVNREGAADIQRREAIPVIKPPPLSPYGTLSNPFGAAPLGPSSMNSTTHHINMPQVTNITIDGANDPSIVAHMVAANQSRVAADMAYNLKGATS